jgi:polyphosphate kinase
MSPVAAKPPAAVPASGAQPAVDPFINRELSWLEFNRRVLAQAEDGDHPLLERVKFLAIVATNLDEFFMIRVAALLRRLRGGHEEVAPRALSTREQLDLVRKAAADMQKRQAACWTRDLEPLLASHGVRFLDAAEWTPDISAFLAAHFEREIFPLLTPLAFDPGHPFPFISNLSLNLAVVVKQGGRTKFARVKLPDGLPRFIQLPAPLSPNGAATFVFLEDVVRVHVASLFPGTTVQGAHLFRIVRDADIVIQADEAHDLLESMDEGLRRRRHGALASLQVEATMPRRVVDILTENFELEDENVSRTKHRLGFGDWMQLSSLYRPDLKYAPLVPVTVWASADPEEIFSDIRERDRLVHHPFQSFGAVESFLRAAVADTHVVAIKMTLYRIGANSPLVDLLLEAAEAGKQVAVLVELKARFDERNNIRWAHRLEAAGVHVVYGVANLKTHCKVCLVVRKETDGIRRYAHIGTGNYNAQTARLYTDIGLFTCRPEIVQDASDLFNFLTGYSNQRDYRTLMVAPVTLRSGLKRLIDREIAHANAGQASAIVIKVNAVVDQDMIHALYRASQAGVTVDLIVRGMCCLRPGVPGLSERITVRSVVDRFLEHSRIYWFKNGDQPEVFIGSADLMERNLDRRVEVVCPVLDPHLAGHLRDVVLGLYLRDNHRADELLPDGRYAVRLNDANAGPLPHVNAQVALHEWHVSEEKTRR